MDIETPSLEADEELPPPPPLPIDLQHPVGEEEESENGEFISNAGVHPFTFLYMNNAEDAWQDRTINIRTPPHPLVFEEIKERFAQRKVCHLTGHQIQFLSSNPCAYVGLDIVRTRKIYPDRLTTNEFKYVIGNFTTMWDNEFGDFDNVSTVKCKPYDLPRHVIDSSDGAFDNGQTFYICLRLNLSRLTPLNKYTLFSHLREINYFISAYPNALYKLCVKHDGCRTLEFATAEDDYFHHIAMEHSDEMTEAFIRSSMEIHGCQSHYHLAVKFLVEALNIMQPQFDIIRLGHGITKNGKNYLDDAFISDTKDYIMKNQRLYKLCLLHNTGVTDESYEALSCFLSRDPEIFVRLNKTKISSVVISKLFPLLVIAELKYHTNSVFFPSISEVASKDIDALINYPKRNNGGNNVRESKAEYLIIAKIQFETPYDLCRMLHWLYTNYTFPELCTLSISCILYLLPDTVDIMLQFVHRYNRLKRLMVHNMTVGYDALDTFATGLYGVTTLLRLSIGNEAERCLNMFPYLDYMVQSTNLDLVTPGGSPVIPFPELRMLMDLGDIPAKDRKCCLYANVAEIVMEEEEEEEEVAME